MNHVQYLFRHGLTPDKIRSMDVANLKITHLDYSFIYLTEDGALTSDKEQAPTEGDILVDEHVRPVLEALADLRKANPSLSIMLSLGGGDRQQSGCFRTVVADLDKVERLGRACGQYLQEFDFDGIDVDWEYPENEEEILQFINLLKVIRKNIGNTKLLSSALPVGQVLANFSPSHVSEINGLMDFWNLMTYDLGLFQNYSFVAPYDTANDDENYGYSSLYGGVEQMHEIGVPYDHMNVGVPSYGKLWREIPDLTVADLGHFFGRKFEGPRARTLHYRMLEDVLQEPGWNELWLETPRCPIYYKVQGDRITDLIAMDNLQATAEKCRLIRSKGCAGVMMWCLNGDNENYDICQVIASEID